MRQARLDDGTTIDVGVEGSGPALLLPVDPAPVTAELAEELRKWGADPDLGRTLIDGLSDIATVIAFDYQGQLLRHPRPDTLTPDAVARDLLSVADAAGVERFAYYGYSWLAVCGHQLALRSGRIEALAMGGFPPLGGPYQEMLTVTSAAHAYAAGSAEGEHDERSAAMTVSGAQTQQFATFYQALQDFDDHTALSRIRCAALCFVGSADAIAYGPDRGGTTVDLAGPIRRNRAELEHHGWQVHLLAELDHIAAMNADQVLPLLRDWLRHPR